MQGAIPSLQLRAAYKVGEWAEACSLSEAEVRRAVTARELPVRRVPSGTLLVTAEDGLQWLRDLPRG